ncbi:MAG: HAD family acid phosphatase [Jatrophihabitans sp.]|uniref:HAD family acid phosphatase n=1 Tax=Jatrophihabitans sp. TaxID=1932789 RepID=UPI003911E0C3
MTRFVPGLRRRVFAAVVASAALGATLLVGSSSATAHNYYRAVPAPPAVPTSADQIQNIDQVKTAIKGYYGDRTPTQMDPVNGTSAVHQFSDTSSYAKEMAGIVAAAEKTLTKHKALTSHGKSILFDIDDTTLNTYSYEIYSNFVYNPSTNAAFVNACLTATGCVFPAVPGMVGLEKFAEARGYTVFFLTGRPQNASTTQLAGTLANLTAVGYDVNPSNVYLKNPADPWLSSCSNGTTITCTTTQYKSLTRQHIESLGYDIVANFGDQYSDLNGGFADNTFKIPNPMYFLP